MPKYNIIVMKRGEIPTKRDFFRVLFFLRYGRRHKKIFSDPRGIKSLELFV